MFKDGVTLSKSAWYMKLLKFMWHYEPENFTNLCPLFWKVVLSIVVFIPWLVIIKPIKTIANFINKDSNSVLAKIFRLSEKAVVNLVWLTFNLTIGFCFAVFVCNILSNIVNRAFYVSSDKLIILFIGLFVTLLLITLSAVAAIISTNYETIRNEENRKRLCGKAVLKNKRRNLAYRILIKPIVDLFKLAFSYIKSTYDKNCPFINWKD